MNSMTYGKRVKHHREERHMTQVELAERSAVSQAYISQLERGVYADLSVSIVLRLALALQVSVVDIIGDPIMEERRAG